MSEVTERLMRARSLAWADLVPAFDHAIAVAQEVEHSADSAAIESMCRVDPVYPPLVLKMAASVRLEGENHD